MARSSKTLKRIKQCSKHNCTIAPIGATPGCRTSSLGAFSTSPGFAQGRGKVNSTFGSFALFPTTPYISRGCDMYFNDAFLVGNCYGSANDPYFYLYVLRIVDQSESRRALYGVLFDSTYRIISKRWFRVSALGGYAYAHCNNVVFSAHMIFSKKDSCFPPDDVLDYFRQAPDGVFH